MSVLNDKKNQDIAKIRYKRDYHGPDKEESLNILQYYFVQFILRVSGNGASTSQRRHLFQGEFLQL